MNTFLSARKAGISHTFNGISSRNDQKRIDYILTRQAHRSRVHDVKVHPQPPPPAKAGRPGGSSGQPRILLV